MTRKLANQFTAWASEQFNSDRKMIPAAVRLEQFCETRHIAEPAKTELFVHLLNQGVL